MLVHILCNCYGIPSNATLLALNLRKRSFSMIFLCWYLQWKMNKTAHLFSVSIILKLLSSFKWYNSPPRNTCGFFPWYFIYLFEPFSTLTVDTILQLYIGYIQRETVKCFNNVVGDEKRYRLQSDVVALVRCSLLLLWHTSMYGACWSAWPRKLNFIAIVSVFEENAFWTPAAIKRAVTLFI